jgi:hypothetical protein
MQTVPVNKWGMEMEKKTSQLEETTKRQTVPVNKWGMEMKKCELGETATSKMFLLMNIANKTNKTNTKAKGKKTDKETKMKAHDTESPCRPCSCPAAVCAGRRIWGHGSPARWPRTWRCGRRRAGTCHPLPPAHLASRPDP